MLRRTEETESATTCPTEGKRCLHATDVDDSQARNQRCKTISDYTPSRQLRSSDRQLLFHAASRQTTLFASRAFSLAAARIPITV